MWQVLFARLTCEGWSHFLQGVHSDAPKFDLRLYQPTNNAQ